MCIVKLLAFQLAINNYGNRRRVKAYEEFERHIRVPLERAAGVRSIRPQFADRRRELPKWREREKINHWPLAGPVASWRYFSGLFTTGNAPLVNPVL